MRPGNKKWEVFFLPAVLLLTGMIFAGFKWYEDKAGALPYFRSADSIESDQDAHFSIPAFSFTNQDGKVLSDSFVRGEIWVAHYFFLACPSICPKMVSGMQRIQTAFKNDPEVRLISLTVDPDDDTTAALKRFAIRKNADLRQWAFGTGSKKSLYWFARKGLGITATDGDGGPGDFIHSDKIVLVDRDLHIRGYYEGTSPAAVDQLIRDISKLKKNSK